jgi:hypothetical protein
VIYQKPVLDCQNEIVKNKIIPVVGFSSMKRWNLGGGGEEEGVTKSILNLPHKNYVLKQNFTSLF